MAASDEEQSGIPTRAVHEAYLDMQRALKRYRTARDKGTPAQVDSAHGDVQESVLTFYELLRPHIKNNDAVKDYWEGELPSYNGNGTPDPEDGKGVLQVQQHREALDWEDVPIDSNVKSEDLREADLQEWHDYLNLNGSVRLTGVMPNQNGLFVSSQRYQIGMRQLDEWVTDFRTKQTELGGFLGSTKTEEKERVRKNISKLKRAARELSDIAEQLGALSEFDASTPRTKISDDLIEDVDEWRKQNINQ